MSNWQILGLVVTTLIVTFIFIPILTYMVTKCFYDAKNQSNFTFLQYLSNREKENAKNVDA